MAFPVPVDVRGTRDFELVKGQDELLRESVQIDDLAADVDVGEWMKFVVSGGIRKAKKLEGSDDLAAPAIGAKVSWTRYRQGDTSAGQADAVATSTLDMISGTYQAKTKLYNVGSGVSDPGALVVAVASGGVGILDLVAPGGPATLVQLQAAVGRILSVASGVLHYEAPA